MSRNSEIRQRRKVRRGIGVARVTTSQMFDRIAIKVMRRLTQAVGCENLKLTQDTAFSLTLDVAKDRVAIAEQILLEEGYLKTHGGEFIHKKMRLSDFAAMGGAVSLVPFVNTRMAQEAIMMACRQPACFSWPQVSEEEVRAVKERLNAPRGI